MKKKFSSDFLFILPALMIVLGILFFCFLFILRTSFFKVGLTFTNETFVGLDNYIRILSDKNFFRATFNTFLYATLRILVFISMGFLLSVALTVKFKGVKWVNSILFLPTLIPVALLALVFRNLFEYNTGTINEFLRFFGLDALTMNWFGSYGTASAVIVFLDAFAIGVAIMYYTADLATVDAELINAATIDGASNMTIIRKILFPLMSNTHKTIIVSGLIGGIRAFDMVFMLTGGGPADTTQILGTYMYDYISSGGLYIGYSSALSLVTIVIAFILSSIQMKTLGLVCL